MTPQQTIAEVKLAGVAVPSALVAFFADTLPILQWCAALLAVVASALAIIKFFRSR